LKWFKHDTDANRDAKLEKVLMRYGAEGYALYWLCLELIAAPIDKHNINFELEHDSEILAYRLKMDSIRVEEIMKYFISIGLFEMDSTSNRVTCLKLANRIENSIIKNPQLKEIQGLMGNDPGQSRKSSARLDKTRLEEIKHRRFAPPSVEEVSKYCKERRNSVNAETFVDFYSSKGWMVGKNKMKDWKAAVRTWEKGEKKTNIFEGAE